MAYIAKHAAGCRYAMYSSEVVSLLEITPVQYKIYWKEKNYSNGFIVFIADADDVIAIIKRFDSEHVDWTLCQQPTTIDDSRQKKQTSFGFSSSINNCHEVAINKVGSKEPRKRENTYDKSNIQF